MLSGTDETAKQTDLVQGLCAEHSRVREFPTLTVKITVGLTRCLLRKTNYRAKRTNFIIEKMIPSDVLVARDVDGKLVRHL